MSVLRRQAPELGVFIDRFGAIKRETTPDLFTALAQAVISQQISAKAMRTVWERLSARFGEPTPLLFLRGDLNAVAGCGIPERKLNYILKNVLISSDRGIRTALCRLCGRKTLTRRDFDDFRKRFSPYATVASFYLWEFANRGFRI